MPDGTPIKNEYLRSLFYKLLTAAGMATDTMGQNVQSTAAGTPLRETNSTMKFVTAPFPAPAGYRPILTPEHPWGYFE